MDVSRRGQRDSWADTVSEPIGIVPNEIGFGFELRDAPLHHEVAEHTDEARRHRQPSANQAAEREAGKTRGRQKTKAVAVQREATDVVIARPFDVRRPLFVPSHPVVHSQTFPYVLP